MAALSAAAAVLVAIDLQTPEVMSMCQFLRMISDLLRIVSDAGCSRTYDWMRYLVTRYIPGDAPQNRMVGFMRSMFGEHVLNDTVLKSTAISDAGLTKQALYQVECTQFTRSTYERARAFPNAVNTEIEGRVRPPEAAERALDQADMARKNLLSSLMADTPGPGTTSYRRRAARGALGAVGRSFAQMRVFAIAEVHADMIDGAGLEDRLGADAKQVDLIASPRD